MIETVLKSVKSIVSKGENTGELSLLYCKCFPKLLSSGPLKQEIVWSQPLTHSHTMTPFDFPRKQAF